MAAGRILTNTTGTSWRNDCWIFTGTSRRRETFADDRRWQAYQPGVILVMVLIMYTYALYPALLMILGAVRSGRRARVVRSGADVPQVSVLLSVYNEAGIVGTRIRNLLATGHPAGRMEILVGSDGSNDGTKEALGEFAGTQVRTFIYPTRRGKAAVLNDLVGEAAHPILVFTDANTVYNPGTIPELLKPFDDCRGRRLR